MRVIRRYYRVGFVTPDGATVSTLDFEAENIALARDHAEKVARDEGLVIYIPVHAREVGR